MTGQGAIERELVDPQPARQRVRLRRRGRGESPRGIAQRAHAGGDLAGQGVAVPAAALGHVQRQRGAVQAAEIVDFGVQAAARAQHRRRDGLAGQALQVQPLGLERGDDAVAAGLAGLRLPIQRGGQAGLVLPRQFQAGRAQRKGRLRQQAGARLQGQPLAGAGQFGLQLFERALRLDLQREAARVGRLVRLFPGVVLTLVLALVLALVLGGLVLGRFVPGVEQRRQAQRRFGAAALRLQIQAGRQRPRLGEARHIEAALRAQRAHGMGHAQAVQGQARAVAARRQAGLQLARAHGQRLAILAQDEFAQAETVQRQLHRQAQGERLVAVGRRRGRRMQADLDARGRQLAHMQQPLAQRPPRHVQPQVVDGHIHVGHRQADTVDPQAAQHAAAHARDLAVELPGHGVEQQARAVLRRHGPEHEPARQRGQHGHARHPPDQDVAHDAPYLAQNAIPNEKCSRRSRSRWPYATSRNSGPAGVRTRAPTP
ncbi:Uncharacterised protein [Bordetella pertussis]|nr:Uncharacterised protein [Bordetella pertussis]